MDVVLATAAALVATVFAVRLAMDYRTRPRRHVALWSVAMVSFSAATIAFAAGLAFGWSSLLFRVFYGFGAIGNIPLLAAGSVALFSDEQTARRFVRGVGLFVFIGLLASFVAPLTTDLAGVAVPEGSQLFDYTITAGRLTLPGPRMFAIVAGTVGTAVVVGLSSWSIVRSVRSDRRRVLANVLIVVGMLAPAFGGSLVALGEGGGLALSLLVGASALYAGFVLATRSAVVEMPAAGSA